MIKFRPIIGIDFCLIIVRASREAAEDNPSSSSIYHGHGSGEDYEDIPTHFNTIRRSNDSSYDRNEGNTHPGILKQSQHTRGTTGEPHIRMMLHTNGAQNK